MRSRGRGSDGTDCRSADLFVDAANIRPSEPDRVDVVLGRDRAEAARGLTARAVR